MEIKILQLDSQMRVEVNGEGLPNIFSDYQIKSSNSEESELWLGIKGNINVTELSTRISQQRQ